MFVLPPGRTLGTWLMTVGLSKPRAAGMGSSTCAPLLNVSRERRSLRASNESMNVRAASRTAGQRPPIEPETSRMSDRSTMRRVASPVAPTVTVMMFPSCMNVVGSTAVAVTVTVLTPVTALTAEV
jgi:hypothetical protein